MELQQGLTAVENISRVMGINGHVGYNLQQLVSILPLKLQNNLHHTIKPLLSGSSAVVGRLLRQDLIKHIKWYKVVVHGLGTNIKFLLLTQDHIQT